MAEPGLEDEEYKHNLRMLKEECDKKRPSLAVEKNLMDATFNTRRKWIIDAEPMVEEIIDAFPCLTKSAHVRILFAGSCIYNASLHSVPFQLYREFRQIAGNVKRSELLQSWETWRERLFSYAKDEATPKIRSILREMEIELSETPEYKEGKF